MYARPQIESGEATTFGVSGKLWRDALIMYDRRSRSLWSQIDGVAKAGISEGQRLRKIPSQVMTWQAWEALHPETLVLVKPALEESPYASYHQNASWVGLPWTRSAEDERLAAKELVLGIDLEVDGALAVSLASLEHKRLISGEIAERALLVIAPQDPRAAWVFSRRLDERRVLEFAWREGRLLDLQTGSEWDVQTGVAITGPLEGSHLEAIAATPIYWGIWVSFHPGTALWS